MDQETGRVSKTAWAPEIDVRIANPPPALLKKYTLKEKAFFYDYASFVVRLIRNEEVTDRIRGEGIDLFRAGCEGLSQRKLRLLYEMSEIAVSTMIHEILHVKFQRRSMSRYGEEALVQELERQFMQGWEEWIRVPVQHAISVIS